jgi:hypothetical protein
LTIEIKEITLSKQRTANKMFLQWCGDVLPKVYIFVQRLVSGTGRGFGSAPLKKHKRYGQFAGRVCIPNFVDDKLVDD